MGILTRQTFCFSPNLLARDNKVSIYNDNVCGSLAQEDLTVPWLETSPHWNIEHPVNHAHCIRLIFTLNLFYWIFTIKCIYCDSCMLIPLVFLFQAWVSWHWTVTTFLRCGRIAASFLWCGPWCSASLSSKWVVCFPVQWCRLLFKVNHSKPQVLHLLKKWQSPTDFCKLCLADPSAALPCPWKAVEQWLGEVMD